MEPPRIWREKRERYLAAGIECKECNKKSFPKSKYCPSCGNDNIMEYKIATTGKIVQFSTVTQTLEEMSDYLPYIVVIIELDDGIRVTGQIVESVYSDLKEGMVVRMVFRILAKDKDEGLIRYGFKFIPK